MFENIGKKNNTRAVQEESSKLASFSLDQGLQIVITPRSPASIPEPIGTPCESDGFLHQSDCCLLCQYLEIWIHRQLELILQPHKNIGNVVYLYDPGCSSELIDIASNKIWRLTARMHRKLIAFSRQGDSLSIYAQEIRPNTNIFGICYYVIEYLLRSGKPFGVRRKGDKCVLVVLFSEPLRICDGRLVNFGPSMQ